MVGTIEEKIIKNLMEGPLWVNQLERKCASNRNSFMIAYKKMKKNGIINQEKSGNKVILSLAPPEDISLKGVMSSLPLAEKRVYEFMKKIKKPLFKHVMIRDMEQNPMIIKPKNKKMLDEILQIINDLVSRSVALTYADCLDSLPRGSEKKIRQYHKQCIITIRKIMQKLQDEFEESELELGSYLYYGVHGYGHLTTLEFMNRNN